jgi:hypothetical protein
MKTRNSILAMAFVQSHSFPCKDEKEAQVREDSQ